MTEQLPKEGESDLETKQRDFAKSFFDVSFAEAELHKLSGGYLGKNPDSEEIKKEIATLEEKIRNFREVHLKDREVMVGEKDSREALAILDATKKYILEELEKRIHEDPEKVWSSRGNGMIAQMVEELEKAKPELKEKMQDGLIKKYDRR